MTSLSVSLHGIVEPQVRTKQGPMMVEPAYDYPAALCGTSVVPST